MQKSIEGAGRENPVHENSGLVREFKLAVIGTGKMARVLAKLLKKGASPLSILLVSRRPRKARSLAKKLGVGWLSIEELREADLVLLTTPSNRLGEIASKIAPHLRPGSIVMDISSVKRGVIEEVAEALPDYVDYVSLHPLFGPHARKAESCTVVVVPVRSKESLATVTELLRRAKFHVVVSTLEEHDKAMAFVQVTHHLLYLAYAMTLWESLTSEQIIKFATRSLEATLLMVRKLRRNLDVVEEIQTLNIYGGESKAKLQINLRLLAEKDTDAWNRLKRALDGLSQIKSPKTLP